jgi:hypothetical protein
MRNDIVISDLNWDETGREVVQGRHHPNQLVEECFHDLWKEAARRFAVQTGDFDIDQMIREQRIKDQLVDLILEYLMQNERGEHE